MPFVCSVDDNLPHNRYEAEDAEGYNIGNWWHCDLHPAQTRDSGVRPTYTIHARAILEGARKPFFSLGLDDRIARVRRGARRR